MINVNLNEYLRALQVYDLNIWNNLTYLMRFSACFVKELMKDRKKNGNTQVGGEIFGMTLIT